MSDVAMSNGINNRNNEVINILKQVLINCNQTQYKEGQVQSLFNEVLAQGSYDIVHLQSKDTQKLRECADSLDGCFLDEELLTKLKELVYEFCDERDALEKNAVSPFISMEQIEKYLSQYYALLFKLMFEDDVINNVEQVKSLLCVLLRLDEDDSKISLFSPLALNAIRKMYIGVEAYWKEEAQSIGGNPCISLMKRNVVVKKAQHTFRWLMGDEGNELLHAAVSPYVPQSEASEPPHELCIPFKNVRDCNSYEGIGELRLADKIRYEYLIDGNGPKCLNVAILGDINPEPMEALEEDLKYDLRRKGKSDYKIVYNVYTKNPFETQSANIKLRGKPQDVLSNGINVEKLIQENDVIFLLDCIELYAPIKVQEEKGVGILKQRFGLGKPFDSLYLDKVDWCKPNLLEELYEYMTVFSMTGYFGSFHKKANDNLLMFCEEKVKEKEGSRCTLYAYVSDLAAFNSLYCNDKYYVRTERYHQKEIGIIRFCSVPEKAMLPLSNEDIRIIYFNAWQIVKHICLDEADTVIDMLGGEGSVNVKDLRYMWIGMDYTGWPKSLVLHCSMEKISQDEVYMAACERFLEKFTDHVAVPLLNCRDIEGNAIHQYLWHALYSMLYSDAQCVQDMLLLHLLVRKSKDVGSASFNSAAAKGDLDFKRRAEYKYSIKRFYEMIIKQYDTSADRTLGQSLTSYAIGRMEAENMGLGVTSEKEMFQNVIGACEQLDYKNYLYDNCKEHIGA